MTSDAVAKVRELEGVLRELPQVEIATEHVLHAGLYARTIRIPAGVVLTGVFIIIPTMLVVYRSVLGGSRSLFLVGLRLLFRLVCRYGLTSLFANLPTELLIFEVQ